VRLRKVEEELKEFQIVCNRLFMTTMSVKPKAVSLAEQNAAAKANGGEGHKSHAEVIALVLPRASDYDCRAR
jgi:hypothetical protein